MSLNIKEIEQLKIEIEYYKKMLIWYRDTYENRSIMGVVKDKINKKIKNIVKLEKISRKSPKLDFISKKYKSIIPAFLDKSSFYSSHAIDPKLLKIAIFIHLFYQDLWDEISVYLSKAGINFDLYVTINEEDIECNSTIKKIKHQYEYATILKVPNKGLDIGSFFELTNHIISKNLLYDYILKIHTKKSLGVNSQVGENWRKKSYESLLGSQSIIFHILRLFAVNPTIGMIGPYESRMSVSMNDFQKGANANANNLKDLSKRLDIKDQNLDFFGGTMFWVKWSLLEAKFKKKTLTINDFEPGYKNDELLSHAMERLIASLVRDVNHKLYELTRVNDYLFYKNKRKKIAWIHPGYGIGGGNRVIFDICQEQLKYYDVYSISYIGQPFTNWMDVNHTVLSFANAEEGKYFIETMDIDFVFATGWQTVALLKNLKDSVKKYYFIQDYEPWFADSDTEIAKATYHNSFNGCIVIADWLKHRLLVEHKLETLFIKLGTKQYPINIDTKIEKTGPFRILFYFKLKSHHGRGADLILLLLKKLSKNTNVELNVFGHEDPKVDGINFHGEVHNEKLLNLYRSNDIFIDLSRHRGIATIALETAQFGVVSFLSAPNFGLQEYGFVDNKNCVIVKDVDDAYIKIFSLCNDPLRYAQLKEGVLALSKNFDWKYTVNDLNQIIDTLT